MLILTRKTGERVIIGRKNIVVKVVAVYHHEVKMAWLVDGHPSLHELALHDSYTAGGVTVRVLGTKSNQVKLGIEAPAGVSVHREEVYERIYKGF